MITVLKALIQLAGDLNLITINYRDGRPIYEQVVDNFRRLIARGVLETNYKMPSVRELASSLAINPNTIQRAYQQLEQEGYIVSLPGKGSFAARPDGPNAARLAQQWALLDRAVAELRLMGIDRDEILAHITEVNPHD